jgi:hypothetical protein
VSAAHRSAKTSWNMALPLAPVMARISDTS